MAAESTPMNLDNESDSAKYGEDISPEKDGGVRKIIKVAGGGEFEHGKGMINL